MREADERRGRGRSWGGRSTVAAALVVALVGGPALADSTVSSAAPQTVDARLDRVATQMASLAAILPPAADEGPAAVLQLAQADGFAARTEVRLSQLERQLQVLTGRVEELQFANDQLRGRLDRALSDIEFRLTTLEGGDPMAASSPSAGPTASAPPSPAPSQNAAGGGTDTTQTLGTLTVTNDADGRTVVTSQAGPNDPNQAYNQAYALLQRSDFPAAESAMRGFVDRFPSHPLASNAQYWVGETLYVRGLFQDAAAAFAQSLRAYPQGAKAVDSMLKLGMTLSAMGQTSDACTTFAQIPSQYPTAPAAITRRAQQERDRLGC